MAFWKKVALLLTFSWVTMSAQAQVMTHLYEANVSAASGQQSALLTRQAWQQVVTKLTGRLSATLPAKLSKPSSHTLQNLVDRFEYRTTPDGRLFHVVFSAPLVNNLLHSVQVPLWLFDRSLTLWWVMTVADDGSVSLLSMESPTAKTVLDLAKSRAYPMVLPLGDLSDQEPLVGMSAALSPGSLQALALRYRVDRVVVTRIKSGLASEWMWWSDQAEPKRWEQADRPDVLGAISAGLARVIGYELADVHVDTKLGASISRDLLVLGANSFVASEALAKRLDAQHAMFHWKHEVLSRDTLRLQLTSSHSRSALRRTLSHIRELTPLLHYGIQQEPDEHEPLIYVWGKVFPSQRAAWVNQYKHEEPAKSVDPLPTADPSSTKSDVKKALSDQDDLEDAQPFAYHAEAAYAIPSSEQATEVMSSQPLLSKVDLPKQQEELADTSNSEQAFSTGDDNLEGGS